MTCNNLTVQRWTAGYDPSMTVMVTGGSGLVGRALVPELVRRDEVRVAVRSEGAAPALRAIGAKVTVGRLDEADALAEVLQRVESLIHLVGGPNHPDADGMLEANHRSVLVAVRAAQLARVRRLIFVSVPGASPDATHPYLRAKGLAEEVVEQSGIPATIVRSTHVYGVGGLWFTSVVQAAAADRPFVAGDGSQLLAPVFVDDLVAVLLAADDRPEPLAGRFGLEGPDVVTAVELLGLLSGNARTAPQPVDPADAAARWGDLLGIPFARSVAELFALPSRADETDARAAFATPATPLRDGLARTLERAASANQ
jgi:NADH dehydrogenase